MGWFRLIKRGGLRDWYQLWIVGQFAAISCDELGFNQPFNQFSSVQCCNLIGTIDNETKLEIGDGVKFMSLSEVNWHDKFHIISRITLKSPMPSTKCKLFEALMRKLGFWLWLQTYKSVLLVLFHAIKSTAGRYTLQPWRCARYVHYHQLRAFLSRWEASKQHINSSNWMVHVTLGRASRITSLIIRQIRCAEIWNKVNYINANLYTDLSSPIFSRRFQSISVVEMISFKVCGGD